MAGVTGVSADAAHGHDARRAHHDDVRSTDDDTWPADDDVAVAMTVDSSCSRPIRCASGTGARA